MSKRSTFGRWLNRLLFPGKEVDALAEEKIVSPGKQMVRSFFHNRLAMTGLVIFLTCLLVVLIGPKLVYLK